MSETWVNTVAEPENVDLKTVAESGNVIEVRDVNAAKPAILATNSSNDAAARALKVEGKAEFNGTGGGNAEVLLRNCKLSTQDANIMMIQPGQGDGFIMINDEAPVLIVSGGLYTDDTTIDGNLRVNHDVLVDQQLEVVGSILVGDANGGKIDAFASAPNQQDLKLGNDSDHTKDVVISRDGQTTHVMGGLTVHGDELCLEGASLESVDAYDLKIGTNGINTYTQISKSNGTTIINGIGVTKGQVALGDSENDGKIDCNAIEANQRSLQIGTQSNTHNVNISRSNRLTTVKGRLDVEEHARIGTAAVDGKIDAAAANRNLLVGTDANATNNVQIGRVAQGLWTKVVNLFKAEGHIQVGAGAVDGKVDASANNRNLMLGTDANATYNVVLGRANRTVDHNCQARMNSKAIVMNGVAAHNVAGSIAMIANAAGHGNGPSIDIWINGVMVRYVDATAWL